ncbi:8560_t:CDS:2 [Cetraspora pellucida]|uniref:8560_t:CDS:1 n=1 Tax=Cetraspora pellucida TaxID=1433469 RepID=A0A9N8W8M0_9GLOM|nr:8560_t:CDS:2 [Cetraspora pellucida]
MAVIKYLFILAFLFFGIVYGRSRRGNSINRDYMLQLVNNVRSDSGVPPLKMDSCLTDSAQSHTSNNGYDWESLGENIANGYSDEDSPHRNNLLNPYYVDCGFGRSGNYWTQDFGRTFEEDDDSNSDSDQNSDSNSDESF